MASKRSAQEIPRLTRSSDALTSSQRWQAITKRDPTINSFVYGVLTTKIYCRPSCAARLARRANVQFYDTPAQAEAAGFRACKRCRPETGGSALASHPQTASVQRACEIIQAQVAMGLKPRLQDLAAQVGLTPSHFHRVFKKRMGVTPGQYVNSLVQGIAPPLSETSTPENIISENTTPPFQEFQDESGRGFLNLGAGESLLSNLWPMEDDFLAAEKDASASLDSGVWNDFDTLLAAEAPSAFTEDPPLAIDPQMISASSV